MYCVVVSDTLAAGTYWSIDSSQTAALVTNALRMAITNRDPQPGVPTMACNSRHGPSPNAPRSGPVPSMAPIGDCYDCVVIEPFWGRMQTKLLNRKTMEHANQAGQRYHRLLEIFPNGQRRHSALGMRRPVMRTQIEFELIHQPSGDGYRPWRRHRSMRCPRSIRKTLPKWGRTQRGQNPNRARGRRMRRAHQNTLNGNGALSACIKLRARAAGLSR